MNDRIITLLTLLLILCAGCAERTEISQEGSDQISEAATGTPEGDGSPLDRLQGVHPNRPVILKTAAYDFLATEDGAKVICSDGQEAGVWDMTSGNKIRSIPQSEIVISFAMPRNESSLLTVAAGRTTPARLWSLETSELLREYPSPLEDVEVTQKVKGKDYGWNLWRHPDIWRFSSTGLVPKMGFGFTSVAFNSDGTKFATGCEDGKIIIWDTKSGGQLQVLNGDVHRILEIAFSTNGKRLLAAAKDDIIQLWDLADSTMIQQFEETRERNWVTGHRPAIAFSSDGPMFALYSPKSLAILICDSGTGDELSRITDRSRLPSGKLQVSMQRGLGFIDSKAVYSNAGGLTRVWNVATGKLVRQQECRSGVNAGYAYPNIEYVQFLPVINAFVAVEVENDENTLHEDWTTVSYRPLPLFTKIVHD